jgi:hypothetical protein
MIRVSMVFGVFGLIFSAAAYAKDDPSSECKYAGEVYSYGSITCQAGNAMRCEGPGEAPNNHIHWLDMNRVCGGAARSVRRHRSRS